MSQNRAGKYPFDVEARLGDLEFAVDELLDITAALFDYSRAGTSDEAPGEREVYLRAEAILRRHHRLET